MWIPRQLACLCRTWVLVLPLHEVLFWKIHEFLWLKLYRWAWLSPVMQEHYWYLKLWWSIVAHCVRGSEHHILLRRYMYQQQCDIDTSDYSISICKELSRACIGHLHYNYSFPDLCSWRDLSNHISVHFHRQSRIPRSLHKWCYI